MEKTEEKSISLGLGILKLLSVTQILQAMVVNLKLLEVMKSMRKIEM